MSFDSEPAHEYQIRTFIIEAESPEIAFEKSVQLGERLNDAYRNEIGDVVRIKFEGFYNIINLQENELGHEAEVAWIDLLEVAGNPPKPRVRERDELSIFR